jgi:magnesium-transporting ATPase (P-type)
MLPVTGVTRRKEVMTKAMTAIRARTSCLLIKAPLRARVLLLTSVPISLLRLRQGSLCYTDIGDTIYYTTGVKRGKCYIVVTDIAKESFVGRTASLVGRATGPGHFQRVMSSIGVTLLVLCVLPSTRPLEAMTLRETCFQG